MNHHSLLFGIALLFAVCTVEAAPVQDIDSELSKLTGKLAPSIKEKGKKKIAVIDFTDLQGNAKGELGKYIAEQLTVNFVMTKPDFAILDRANLQRILAEHNLTAKGLVDPENAKKLGMFAGVDALVLGTIIPKGAETIALNAKVITTDTAEIIAAERGEFRYDELVEQFQPKPKVDVSPKQVSPTSTEPRQSPPTASSQPGRQPNQPSPVSTRALVNDRPQVVKSFGDLSVEVNSLNIAGGKNYVLDLVLKNQSTKKSIWVGVSAEQNGLTRVGLTDPERFQFHSQGNFVSGIEISPIYYDGTIYKATEIQPGDSLSASINFFSRSGRTATAGQCNVQLEFVSSQSMNPTAGGKGTKHNLGVKMEAK